MGNECLESSPLILSKDGVTWNYMCSTSGLGGQNITLTNGKPNTFITAIDIAGTISNTWRLTYNDGSKIYMYGYASTKDMGRPDPAILDTSNFYGRLRCPLGFNRVIIYNYKGAPFAGQISFYKDNVGEYGTVPEGTINLFGAAPLEERSFTLSVPETHVVNSITISTNRYDNNNLAYNIIGLGKTPIVNGGWSEWSGCKDGKQTRSCSNPYPIAGKGCEGNISSRDCCSTCWGAWSDWSDCVSENDGTQGTQQRTRVCSTSNCVPDSEGKSGIDTRDCEVSKDVYSDWVAAGSCQKNDGTYSIKYTRTCSGKCPDKTLLTRFVPCSQPATNNSYLYWLIPLLVIVLAIIVAIVFYLRKRSSSVAGGGECAASQLFSGLKKNE